MAAGLGFKTFTSGEVLTAADTNGYLMQGINVFANASARTAAITSPQEGQYSYLKDTNSTEYYDGSAWVAGVEGDISGVTAGVGISGGGTSGTVTVTNSMATAIDAKGDLIAGTGADAFSRLAAGANDLVLTAASGEATGLKYSGGWSVYTPTFTNLTVGNGSLTSRYAQIGKIVYVYIALNFGSTSSMGTNPYFTLPVTSAASGSNQPFGSGYIEDSGVAGYVASVNHRDSTTAQINAILSNGTYLGNFTALTATLPFTWGTNDFFNIYFSYQAAA